MEVIQAESSHYRHWPITGSPDWQRYEHPVVVRRATGSDSGVTVEVDDLADGTIEIVRVVRR